MNGKSIAVLLVPSVKLVKEFGEKVERLFDAVEFIQWLDLGLMSSYLESMSEWGERLKGLFALLQLCINIWKLGKWLSFTRKGVNSWWRNLDVKDCGESLEGISETAVFLGGGKKLGEEWLGVGDMSKALDIVEKWGEFFKSVCSVGEFLVDDFWKNIQASPDPSPVPDIISCPEPYPEPYHGPSRDHPDICGDPFTSRKKKRTSKKKMKQPIRMSPRLAAQRKMNQPLRRSPRIAAMNNGN